jgi:hypothetical protein
LRRIVRTKKPSSFVTCRARPPARPFVQHPEPVGLPSWSPAPDLAPDDGLEIAPGHLGERQPEGLQRGLRAVVREDEAGLEAAERDLVAIEVLDQHRHARQPPRAQRGEAEQRRLPLGRNA